MEKMQMDKRRLFRILAKAEEKVVEQYANEIKNYINKMKIII